ncbi:MAG TPA: hypothetical protein VFD43_12365 [Planctomycetota bacterium]|nr:hypothetical protein [Planctomycetota bacterium]
MHNAVLPVGHRDVVPHELTAEEFEACARRVSGWDVIIVLYSYGSGRDVIDHPALARRTSDLRNEVRDVDGYMSEGVYTVIVIRDERIVEKFRLIMTLPAYDGSNVVLSRDG